MFILDSWLEKQSPCIRILNEETGYSILEFNEKEIQTLLRKQIIDIQDLAIKDKFLEQESIAALFRYSARSEQSNIPQLTSSAFQC